MYLTRNLTRLTLAEVAVAHNRGSPGVVNYAYTRISYAMENPDDPITEAVRTIEKELLL